MFYTRANSLPQFIPCDSLKDDVDWHRVKLLGGIFCRLMPQTQCIEGTERMMIPQRLTYSCSILVVNNQESVCRILKEFLTLQGYRFISCANSREALDQIGK